MIGKRHSSAILAALGIGFFLWAPAAGAQAAKSAANLTVDDVIKLAKAGLSEDIIIQQIRKHNRPFNLSTDQLIALKTAKVSDRVIEIMLDPSTADAPAGPAPAPAPSPAAAPTPPSPPPAQPAIRPVHPPVVKREPAESRFPTEVGVYARKQDRWVEVSPEIVYWRTGGMLKTIATAGIKHGDVNGRVEGTASPTAFQTPLEFLIVAPEGTVMAEYQLLRLHVNKDNREFRTVTGGLLHSQSGSQRDQIMFDGKKVSSRVFRITFPSSAGPGEYGILPPSSNSGSGKIYSFRITE